MYLFLGILEYKLPLILEYKIPLIFGLMFVGKKKLQNYQGIIKKYRIAFREIHSKIQYKLFCCCSRNIEYLFEKYIVKKTVQIISLLFSIKKDGGKYKVQCGGFWKEDPSDGGEWIFQAHSAKNWGQPSFFHLIFDLCWAFYIQEAAGTTGLSSEEKEEVSRFCLRMVMKELVRWWWRSCENDETRM